MTARLALMVALALALPRAALALDPGDPALGEGVFQTRCGECHAVNGDQVKIGPPLTGLIGRVSGGWPGYAYSEAMAGAGITWSVETLAEYLVAPRKMVPKTKMNFNGLKRPGELENLIAYLQMATAPQ